LPVLFGLRFHLVALRARIAILDRDFHLPWFGSFFYRQRNRQDAVFIIGLYFIGFNCRRNGEAANKFAVAALNPVIALHVLFFFELALTANRQGLVLD